MSSIWATAVYRHDSYIYLYVMLQYGLIPVLCGLKETFSIYLLCFLYMMQINLFDIKIVILLTLSRTLWFEGQYIFADLLDLKKNKVDS